MSLFDKLKDTKLKSLKFGDKGTTGDSTKPYIVTDINTADTFINKFRLTKFDDGLIRGGAVGAANAGITDTIRIGKFLTDFPKGPLFIAKQVGLQLSNPPLETKQLGTNITGTGLFGKIAAGAINVANKINNLVGGPTRIYNLGINTLAQVPVNAVGGHIARHGFLPNLDESQKYESVVTTNNKNGNNRLEGLYKNLFKSVYYDKHIFRSNTSKTIISNNLGGAKSTYGIGYTTIRRTIFTGNEIDIITAKNKSETVSRKILPEILEYANKSNTIYQKYKLKYNTDANVEDFKYHIPKTSNKKYNDLAIKNVIQNDITIPITLSSPSDGIQKKRFKNIDGMIIRNPTNFSIEPLDYDYNLSKLDDIYKRTDDNVLQITFTQLDPFSGGKLNTIPFSAYLSGYTENYDSSWDSIKYNGRSDFLYTFNSYKKTASFKLQIPVFNPYQLKSKHESLKTLQTGLAGKYLNNRLGGVMTKINLGYYLYDAVCIINNLSISIPNDASWDWGVDNDKNLAYAMLLEATFQITVIDNKIPGFNETIVTTPVPKVENIKTSDDILKTENALADVNVKNEKEKKKIQIKNKTNFKFVDFGGGDFSGAGAGGGF